MDVIVKYSASWPLGVDIMQSFDRSLSATLDRVIIALEASRPAARPALRKIKRSLEQRIPAAQIVRGAR